MAGTEAYLLLIMLWVTWCTLHSLLISNTVANLLVQRGDSSVRFYRLGYNLFSIASLTVPILYGYQLRAFERPIWVWPPSLISLRLLLFLLALALFWAGSKQYHMKSFLGITQLKERRWRASMTSDDVFAATGVSGVIRHPWYLGGILLVWSVPATFYPSVLIAAAIITLYFFIGIVLEERKLVSRFGDSYRNYQQEVSMLIPYKWLKKNIFN